MVDPVIPRSLASIETDAKVLVEVGKALDVSPELQVRAQKLLRRIDTLHRYATGKSSAAGDG